MEEWPLMTLVAPQEMPHGEEACESEGANCRISGHEHSPVSQDSPEYCDEHQTNPNPVTVPSDPRPPSPAPVTTPHFLSPWLSMVLKAVFPGGWWSGVTCCAIMAATTFLINLVFLVSMVSKNGYKKGFGTIFEGNCKTTTTLNTVAHLFANASSTAILSASNYTMQVLSAPTRQQVDEAHKKMKWLDIGVPSVKNLRKVGRVNLILWCILGMSSVPLHLLYNSAIISSAISSYHGVYIRTERNVTGNTLGFEYLNTSACLEAYGLVTDLQDAVIVVSSVMPESADSSYFDTWTVQSTFESIESRGGQVMYCLHQHVPRRCSLHYSLYLMTAVIICNAVLFGCMLMTLFKISNKPLVTLGDAIVSFIETPDRTTATMCTLSKQEIKCGMWEYIIVGNPQGTWKQYRPFWFRVVGTDHWVLCHVVSLVGILIAAKHLSIKTLIGIEYSSTGSDSLEANVPQVIFSLQYLMYNSLYTRMLLAYEWDRFSQRPRTLRVTSPVGAQRSTYFLQLPYKYMLPLITAMGLLHWLASRCFFLSLEYTPKIENIQRSPQLVVVLIVFESLILVTGIGLGFRRYGGLIPVAGSCSAAISAACHPDPPEPLIATRPVMWGVTSKKDDRDSGHCSFSNNEVSPALGQWYSAEVSECEGKGVMGRCVRCKGVVGGG